MRAAELVRNAGDNADPAAAGTARGLFDPNRRRRSGISELMDLLRNEKRLRVERKMTSKATREDSQRAVESLFDSNRCEAEMSLTLPLRKRVLRRIVGLSPDYERRGGKIGRFCEARSAESAMDKASRKPGNKVVPIGGGRIGCVCVSEVIEGNGKRSKEGLAHRDDRLELNR
jgi:hypothetical protein